MSAVTAVARISWPGGLKAVESCKPAQWLNIMQPRRNAAAAWPYLLSAIRLAKAAAQSARNAKYFSYAAFQPQWRMRAAAACLLSAHAPPSPTRYQNAASPSARAAPRFFAALSSRRCAIRASTHHAPSRCYAAPRLLLHRALPRRAPLRAALPLHTRAAPRCRERRVLKRNAPRENKRATINYKSEMSASRRQTAKRRIDGIGVALASINSGHRRRRRQRHAGRQSGA